MQSPEGHKIATRLRRSLHRLVIATVVLYLAIFGIGYYVFTVARNNSEGLCAFRNDIDARIASSKKYIKEHPRGSRAIPLSTVRVSLALSERTRSALKHVHCPPPPSLNIGGDNKTDTDKR